ERIVGILEWMPVAGESVVLDPSEKLQSTGPVVNLQSTGHQKIDLFFIGLWRFAEVLLQNAARKKRNPPVTHRLPKQR
ncbi:MAG TPA: hypothetical protein PLC24_09410, partial [Myxococcota bacterium]|nr:hypothetical protein [Myxococcota bacterium]